MLPSTSVARRGTSRALLVLLLSANVAPLLSAQPPAVRLPDVRIEKKVVEPKVVETPVAQPVSTLTSATANGSSLPVGTYTLDDCIHMGLDRQPALKAARASLAAAETNQEAVLRIHNLAKIFSPDLPVRRQQSCLGVQIAQAGLMQAEWDTRYAITRNYYSVIYARQQEGVAANVVNKIDDAVKMTKKLVDAGVPEFKVTQIDIEMLTVNRAFVEARSMEAKIGSVKALAALREAIGLSKDDQFDVVAVPLPPLVHHVNKDEMISLALSQRGEIVQASNAAQIACLEVEAQSKIRHSIQTKTFAAASDIHAKPIPTAVANTEYRPGAEGPEMPVYLVGTREERMERARHMSDRFQAVVEKTQGLLTLEVEVAYLKWKEHAEKVKTLEPTPKMAAKIFELVKERFDKGQVTGEEMLRAQTLEDQARLQYNEALYNHALGLAALERVTAGGYRLRP